jgi:hypothetical protein
MIVNRWILFSFSFSEVVREGRLQPEPSNIATVAADRGGRSGQRNLFLYGDSGMFIHNKQNLNSEGWKTMTRKTHIFCRFLNICSRKGIYCCDCP